MSISYYLRLKRRFGYRALLFLFLSKFRKSRRMDVKLRGLRYRLSLSNFSADVTTLFQIFFAEEYKVQLSSPPSHIIDCGANIGLSAVYFANKYPDAKIIAIEPDEGNFRYLKLNTEKYPNVICLKKAVWPRKEALQIVDPGRGDWGLQTRPATDDANPTVDTVTIDELMYDYKMQYIDFLKIDIEGAEKELFTAGYHEWLSRTRVMAIELHDFLDPTVSPVFFETIEPYHFKTYSLGENLVCTRELS